MAGGGRGIAVGAPSRSDRIPAVINVTEGRFQEIFHGKIT